MMTTTMTAATTNKEARKFRKSSSGLSPTALGELQYVSLRKELLRSKKKETRKEGKVRVFISWTFVSVYLLCAAFHNSSENGIGMNQHYLYVLM